MKIQATQQYQPTMYKSTDENKVNKNSQQKQVQEEEEYRDISKDEKVKTNEVEFEHYMNMLQIRGDALKEKKRKTAVTT